jgi:predicted transcriptional regulator
VEQHEASVKGHTIRDVGEIAARKVRKKGKARPDKEGKREGQIEPQARTPRCERWDGYVVYI